MLHMCNGTEKQYAEGSQSVAAWILLSALMLSTCVILEKSGNHFVPVDRVQGEMCSRTDLIGIY